MNAIVHSRRKVARLERQVVELEGVVRSLRESLLREQSKLHGKKQSASMVPLMQETPESAIKVLQDAILFRMWDLTRGSDEYCIRYSAFASDGIDLEVLRAVMRGLRNDGYVVYTCGAMDEDGYTAGSGYILTGHGVNRVKSSAGFR